MKCLTRLLPLLLAIAPVRADEAWPDIFDPFQVQTIYLQLDPQKWDAVRHDTDFYDTQSDLREPCQLWMSGDTPPNSFATSITVELRRKSDPALPSEANPQKVSLKIDVNEYVKGQSVRGLKKLSLENGGGGNGILKEGFAMNLHRMAAEAGYYPLNAGNASWVRLVVNGQYVGLYSFPEQRDKTFFENRGRFKEHATWLYEINGGILLDDNVNTTNSPTHAELNYYPFRGPNAPPANFEQEVSDWVDMRAMLTLASIESFVANTDGLFTKSASNQGKNSFCADFLPSLKEPRVYLPWDLDGGFSSTTWDIFAGGSGQQSQRRYQNLILQHAWFGEMYRQTFTELLDGPLSQAALNAWLDRWEAAVGPALAEDPNADQGQVASLRNYIAARIPNIRTQIGTIIQPPAFAPGEGEIAGGFTLAMGHPNATGTSTIHYTLDGSDPRAYGGAVKAGALSYFAPLAISGNTHVRARVRNVNGSTVRWSNLREATFNTAGTLAALKLTKIHFRPLGAASFDDADEFEFLEFKNTGASPLNLSSCRLEGVDYVFPPGTVVESGAFVVLVANPAAFEARYPGVPHLGVYSKNLNNTGEKLRLRTPDGSTVISCEYSAASPWPLGPQASGRSLVNHDSAGNPDDAENWRASTNVHGSPGAEDPAPSYTPGLVIQEILAHGSSPGGSAIELHNPTASPIAIGGWWLSNAFDPVADPTMSQFKKFRIPVGTSVPAGGCVMFDDSQFHPPSPTAAARVPFELGAAGGAVYLASADAAENLTGHVIGQSFGAAESGGSQGRVTTSTGWDFAPLQAPTLGATTAVAKTGPVVISEIHYHPADAGVEFVELANTTGAEVSIDGWNLGGATFTFPAGTVIPANGLLAVADTADPAGFRSSRGVPAAVPVLAGTFDLDNAGEALELRRPHPVPGLPDLRVDRVRYNDKAPWPTEADGHGHSLEKSVAAAFGNDPLAWHSATPGGSPGLAPVSSARVLVAPGSGWSYQAQGRDLGTAWRANGYSDSGWLSGAAPLGFGTTVKTILPYTAPPQPVTTWLRKEFSLTDALEAVATLTTEVNYNDGFVAYLNGTEVARRSLPASPSFTTPAEQHPHGSLETIDLTALKSLLVPGRNVLAVELHLASAVDGDAYFDAGLRYTLAASGPADSDGDGMPDDWETTASLAPGDPADAESDLDGDGFTALDEYFAGTDPNSAASRPLISSVTPLASGWRIEFPSVAGRTYVVQRSSDLDEWLPLTGDLPGTGEALVVDDPVLAAKRFYRIAVRPTP